MKQLRIPLAATVLALVFSIPALAGDMQCGVTSEPASQSTTSAMQAGVTATDETTNSETITVDPVTETTLQLMVSVLSLF